MKSKGYKANSRHLEGQMEIVPSLIRDHKIQPDPEFAALAKKN